MIALHQNEIIVDETIVRELLRAQRPDLAELALSTVGGGTDNLMYRLGDELVVRLPRSVKQVEALQKEQIWLPRLADQLPIRIPQPHFAGQPDPVFGLPWAIYQWIDGVDPLGVETLDWSVFGADLALFVRRLHAIDLAGAARGASLEWYRGGPLQAIAAQADQHFAAAARLVPNLDVGQLRRCWSEALNLSPSEECAVWLHGDLRPANLLARAGRLHAVIDFGGLSIGLPDAEHAPIWDLPAVARGSYRDVLQLADPTWSRARAWSIFVGIAGLAYYWQTWPQFSRHCVGRLRAIIAEDS
ncbi:MAG: aminoglycoside phosphotransferase family protein [Antricoccus sp.]